MRRFPIEVKVFVIEKRRDGKEWSEIKQAIRETFNMEPPTVRAMQRWDKELDRAALSKALKERAKKDAQVAKEQTVTMLAQDLLPTLWKAVDAGEELEYTGWNWFFRLVETSLGTQKFKSFMGRYLKEREGQPELMPAQIDWASETRTQE
ncbi:MAG: hypothetical protein PHI12_01575 [Dehalococcoidales bacterium]|nr:hypothetical protein [Dehalococcoidales bacterium]